MLVVAVVLLTASGAAPGSAHWYQRTSLQTDAGTGDVALSVEAETSVEVEGCIPGSYGTACEKIENGELSTLPDVRNGVGRVRFLAWIDKPGEPGEHVGFVVEVTDAVVSLTVVSGNPDKPTGDLTELENLVPGTYAWVNDACSLDAAGSVSCDPASTSAISHVDLCITAETGAICPAPSAQPIVVRNEGSIPLAVSMSIGDVSLEPAGGALCDGTHLEFELAESAEPPVVVFSGDVCAAAGATVDMGSLDPGASGVVTWRLIPGPALGATHNGTTVSFDLHAVGAVWAVPGAWESSAHVPLTVAVGGEPLALPPVPDPPDVDEPPGDEPPGDDQSDGDDPPSTVGPPGVEPPPEDPPPVEPPPGEPPAEDPPPVVEPPPAEPPPAEPPPAEPPPAEPPPAEPPPAENPPPELAPPPGDGEASPTFGYVRLGGDNERIAGSPRNSGEADLTIVLLAAIEEWTTGEEHVLVSQWGPEPADRSFQLGVTPDGGVQLLVYDDGLVTLDTGSTDLADGEWVWLRVALDATTDDGATRLDVYVGDADPTADPAEIDWGDPAWTVNGADAVVRPVAEHRDFLIGGHGLNLGTAMRVAYVELGTSLDLTDEAPVFRSDWRHGAAEFTGRPPQRVDDHDPDLVWTLLGSEIEAVPAAGAALLGFLAGSGSFGVTTPRKKSAGIDRRSRRRQPSGGR